MLKIDTPTKKTFLGINLHNPIWLLIQSTVLTTGPVNTSIDRFFANPVVLSVLIRFTDPEYPFGILKPFLVH